MKPGFRGEEEELEPELPNYGVGHAGGVSDSDDDGPELSFTNHIYLRVQIGPFTFVVGRPE